MSISKEWPTSATLSQEVPSTSGYKLAKVKRARSTHGTTTGSSASPLVLADWIVGNCCHCDILGNKTHPHDTHSKRDTPAWRLRFRVIAAVPCPSCCCWDGKLMVWRVERLESHLQSANDAQPVGRSTRWSQWFVQHDIPQTAGLWKSVFLDGHCPKFWPWGQDLFTHAEYITDTNARYDAKTRGLRRGDRTPAVEWVNL